MIKRHYFMSAEKPYADEGRKPMHFAFTFHYTSWLPDPDKAFGEALKMASIHMSKQPGETVNVISFGHI